MSPAPFGSCAPGAARRDEEAFGRCAVASLPTDSKRDPYTIFRSTAVLRLMRRLSFPWSMLYGFTILPVFIRDYGYDKGR